MAALISKTALRVNAVVALVALAAAGALISLALTQPDTVATALAQHDYGAMAAAVGHEVAGWLRALLRFL